MTNANPYVGPVPYQREDMHLFFGREEEAELLLAQLISDRVTLFYAQSGAGKSSLLNARIIPNLEARRYEVLPLIRFSRGLPDPLPEVKNIYIFNTLQMLPGGKNMKALASKTLSEYFKSRYAERQEGRPHWLIFDQFEELLTAFPEQTHTQREEFFQQLQEALDVDRMLSVLFVLREDHLAELDRYAPILTDRLRSRRRLERLEREAAMEAVAGPAAKGGRPFEEAAARRLIENLSQVNIAGRDETFPGDYVEPVQLQIACYRMWESLKNVPGNTITLDDVEQYGDVNKALEDFYDDAVVRVAEQTNTSQTSIRRWFGEQLITPTRVRAQVGKGYRTSGGLPNRAVELFLDQEHIIRVEQARGGKWYELAHDRFIDPILKANERWLPKTETDLAVAAKKWQQENDESYLFRGKRLREAKKWYDQNSEAASHLERDFIFASLSAESKNSRIWYTAALLLTLLLFATSVYAWKTKQKSDNASKQLEAAQKKAEDAEQETNRANRTLEIAKTNLADAEAQYKSADDARDEVNKKLEKALKAKNYAEARRQIEEELRQDAIKQKDIAEQQTAKATTQMGIADEQRRLVETLGYANQIETKGETALEKNDMAEAEIYFASALTLVDRMETRSHLVEASSRGARKLWTGPPQESYGFGLSEDGHVLASLDANQRLLFWDTEKGAKISLSPPVKGEFLKVALDKNGLTGKLLSRTTNPETSQRELTITSYDVATGAEIRSFSYKEEGAYSTFIFSPDARVLVATIPLNFVRTSIAIDTETGRVTSLEGKLEEIYEPLTILSRDGRLFAMAQNSTINLWDTSTGKKLTPIEIKIEKSPEIQGSLVNTYPISAVFSPDGKRLALAAQANYKEEQRAYKKRELIVYDVGSGQKVQSLTIKDGVEDITFSEDGRALNLRDSKSLSRWDIDRNSITSGPALSLPKESDLTFSADGRRIAVQAKNQGIQVLDVGTGKLLSRLPAAEPNGHEEPVNTVAFSPDGQLLASGSDDSLIILREAASGKIKGILKGHTEGVNSIAFSPDGQTLISAGSDRAVILWDVKTLQERRRIDVPRTSTPTSPANLNVAIASSKDLPLINCLAFSPDGRTLAMGGDNGVILFWDVKSWKEIHRIEERIEASATNTKSANTSANVATVSNVNANVANSNTSVPRMVPKKILSVAFSPDGKTLASAGSDETVRLWSMETFTQVNALPGHKNPVYSLAFSPDGQMLASADAEGTVRLWSLKANYYPQTLPGERARVRNLAFSADGERLAVGCILKDQRKGIPAMPAIQLWDPVTTKLLNVIRIKSSDREDPVGEPDLAVAFSRDGLLAAGGGDKAVRVWQVIAPSPLTGMGSSERRTGIFSGDGRVFAYMSDGEYGPVLDSANILHVRNVDSGKEIKLMVGGIVWRGPSPDSLSLSPDGRLLAAIGSEKKGIDTSASSAESKRRLIIWDIEQGTIKQNIPVSTTVSKIVFSPDNSLLAIVESKDFFQRTQSQPNKVTLLNIETGDRSREFIFKEDSLFALAFSPDNEWLVVGGGASNPNRMETGKKTIGIWNLKDNHQSTMVVGRKGAVLCLAFSPDPSQALLAIGEGNNEENNDDPTLALLDLKTRQRLPMFSSFKETIGNIAFAPKRVGDNLLITQGTALRLWNLEATPSRAEDSLILSSNTTFSSQVAFSSDGQWLFQVGSSSSFTRLNMKMVTHFLYGRTEEIFAGVERDTGLTIPDLDKGKFEQISQRQLEERLKNKYNYTFDPKTLPEQPVTSR